MALITKQSKFINPTPSANFETTGLNIAAGDSDYCLIAIVAMSNGRNFTSATFGGDPMQVIYSTVYNSISQRVMAFKLMDPQVGSNKTFRVNFNGSVWTPISIQLHSFANCDGQGDMANSGVQSSPNSVNLSVTQGSRVITTGISNDAQSIGYLFGGTNSTTLFNHNTNKIVGAAKSSIISSSGSLACSSRSNSASITNLSIEVLSKGSTPEPPSQNSGGFFNFM